MERERKILLDGLSHKSTRHELTHVLNNIDLENPKSAKASEEARKKGNALLLQQKKHDAQTHKAIFSHYCESIALAPIESQELAFAYGNRSYFLLHIHQYEDCIKDIDRALKITTISHALKTKLFLRKIECVEKLDPSHMSTIPGMPDVIDIMDDVEDKIKLMEMVDVKEAEKSSKEKNKTNDHDLPLTDDYSSCVSIQYSEKFGRHLVAAKDYNPGDIIFVEKLYASAFVEGSSLITCDYCLKPVWSSIPCSYCNWTMYCSDNCKEKAWNDYHDIECSLVSFLKQYCKMGWKSFVMPVRVLIIGINETGSIANLKKELELLDQSTDVSSKGFFKNGQFVINSIRNVYCLASFAPEDFTEVCVVVPLILISLTKYSKLKDYFDVKKIEDLVNNEDIIFLGSLLVKIMAVLSSNAFDFTYDTRTSKQSEIVHFDDRKCLSTLFSLLNHSCFPTAHRRYTEQNKLLVFAVQPIKKNSQIFISYGYSYEDKMLRIRQGKLSGKYNFTCECQACVEAWPIVIEAGRLNEEIMKYDKENYFVKGNFSLEIINKVQKVLQEGGQVDKSHIKKLSLTITQCSNYKQPSTLFYLLISLLRDVFTAIYAPKSLLFDKCD